MQFARPYDIVIKHTKASVVRLETNLALNVIEDFSLSFDKNSHIKIYLIFKRFLLGKKKKRRDYHFEKLN